MYIMWGGNTCSNDYRKDVIFQKLLKECGSLLPGNRLSYSFRSELEICSREDRRDIVNRIHLDHSPFFLACVKGLAEVVEYMIRECSADIEQRGTCQLLRDRCTPLGGAAFKGHLPIVEILLTHGADINAASDKEGSTPVLSACEQNHKEVVEYLVEHGADVNRSDITGNTCLMKSVCNTALCDFLLKKGVNIDAVDYENKTAFYYAIYRRSEESMKFLQKSGANPYTCSIHGDDALRWVCMQANVRYFEYFVINITYTPERLANSLEVMGMALFSEQRKKEEAYNHWKLALLVRQKHGLLPKTPIMPLSEAYQFAKEFESLEELSVINRDPIKQQIQSLLVAERCLGPHHEKTLNMMLTVGFAIYYSGYYDQFVNIWKRSLKLRIEKFSLLTQEMVYHVEAILRHILGHYSDLPKNEENDQQKLYEIGTVFKLTTEHILEIRPLLDIQPACESQVKCFDSMLKFITELMYIMLEIAVTEENKGYVMEMILNFMKKNVKTVGSRDTVLHLFVSLNELKTCPRESILRYLLKCVVDINARNNEGCSPLYTAMLPEHFLEWVVKLLLEYGAHVDQTNYANDTPLDLITKMNQRLDTDIKVFNYTSLKCLCARVVAQNKTPYTNVLPETLRKWMALHEHEHSNKAEEIANFCLQFVSLGSA